MTDKDGKEIPIDSIVYGYPADYHEKYYFNYGLNHNGELEMFACTYGYVHDLTQEILSGFEYIGPLKDNIHLLDCD